MRRCVILIGFGVALALVGAGCSSGGSSTPTTGNTPTTSPTSTSSPSTTSPTNQFGPEVTATVNGYQYSLQVGKLTEAQSVTNLAGETTNAPQGQTFVVASVRETNPTSGLEPDIFPGIGALRFVADQSSPWVTQNMSTGLWACDGGDGYFAASECSWTAQVATDSAQTGGALNDTVQISSKDSAHAEIYIGPLQLGSSVGDLSLYVIPDSKTPVQLQFP